MCGICRRGSFAGSSWIDDAVSAECAWPNETTGLACQEAATVEAHQRVVVEHRCGACMALLVRLELPSGVLGGGGVFLTNESASIDPPEVCGRCGGPASFALIERISMPLCGAHAASSGWLPDRRESLSV